MEQGKLLTGLLQHFSCSHGLLSIFISGVEAMAKVRLTAKQLTSAGPALQLRWEKFFEHSPDKPMGIIAICAG